MCALHPYCPRDEEEEEPEFNLHCHHGCIGITKGPLEPDAFKRLQKEHDRFSRREWDLKGPLRTGASDDELRDLLRFAVRHKELKHRINEPGFVRASRSMSQIGG